MKTTYALGIIDAQRGFMPAAEGERLGLPGFGELPIPDGEKIVPAVNRLLARFAILGSPSFVTQDWHPQETAHFSAEPNFTTTWPVHCVGHTPGAELHPEIEVPVSTSWFIKGFEPLERGEDDTSYSGYNAYNENMGLKVPEYLEPRRVTTLVLAGLALDYCVGKTALDFKQKMGLDVIVAIDATQAVAPESGNAMLAEFARNDIGRLNTDQIMAMVA